MRGGLSVGVLLRKVLENDLSFECAVKSLCSAHIVAPCYISVCGVKKDEGVLLTRDRNPLEIPKQFNKKISSNRK